MLISARNADVAQLVEHNLAKVGVAGSNPVVRSNFSSIHAGFPHGRCRVDLVDVWPKRRFESRRPLQFFFAKRCSWSRRTSRLAHQAFLGKSARYLVALAGVLLHPSETATRLWRDLG